MTSRTEHARRAWPVVWIAVAAGAVLATALIGARLGGPAIVLWLAFCALAGALLLFQEALRSVLDPESPAPDAEGATAARDALAGLEARKRDALRALKDIDFEHSIRRLSDDDYAMLRERYRAEARAAMEAMDASLGAYLARAETLIDRAESGGEVADDEAADDAAPPANRKRKRAEAAGEASAKAEVARRACAACGTSNEPDAVFCKKCGAKVGEG